MRIGHAIGRSATYVSCLWPGLPRLWCEGRWSALVVALGFTTALNLLLLATFVASPPLGGLYVGLGWLAIVFSWTIGIWRSARYVRRVLPDPGTSQDLFIQAQAEYLRGHWFEAEALLEKLLQGDSRDVDAHLMLATLCRRTGRVREARRRLRALKRREGSEKWQLEIEQELRRLSQATESCGSSMEGGTALNEGAAAEATRAA